MIILLFVAAAVLNAVFFIRSHDADKLIIAGLFFACASYQRACNNWHKQYRTVRRPHR